MTVKRACDILLSCIALLLLFPFVLPVAVLLRVTGEGEIFFTQRRIGFGGKPFRLVKFATMLKDSPNIGTGTVTLKNDPRVLPVGKFLRRTKVNELPQLLNVLWGDMSLVGPRPQTPRCFEAFPPSFQTVIVKVKPGLSGIGSLVFRGEEDILVNHSSSEDFYDSVIAPYKGALEAWYVENQSIFIYFAVIFLTSGVVLCPSSSLFWRVFRGLPVPPQTLRRALNYPA